jgi:Amt family ammonium transporter
MNNDLRQTNPKGVYVTSIVGSYNSQTDIVELSNAGHLPALFKNGEGFKEYESSSLPLGIKKADNSNEYKLESFKLDNGRLYCFTDGFSECRNDKGEEIGIAGVKDLINSYQNTSLKKELSKIIKDVESKSTKGQNFDQNNDENILEDDLTIIGLGK